VLVVGDLPAPQPGAGEVRIRISTSGINPGDVGKRSGGPGAPMPFPRVIPHSDGAGVIDAVGPGVDDQRLGQWVWCYGAQSYRPFGTAAEYSVVPDALAMALPDTVDTDVLDQSACLGIAGITAHRALFADGPVGGLDVLVYGAAGGVGSIATQLAARAGAPRHGRRAFPRTTGHGPRVGRLLGSDDFTPQVKALAARGLTTALVEGTLHITIAERLPLESIATGARTRRMWHKRRRSASHSYVILHARNKWR
jgi:hypothetical protein